MKVHLAAVGRLKAGPERSLVERYLERAARAGPAVGLSGFAVVEVPEGRAARAEARRDEEAAALAAALPRAATLILLDEAGAAWSSRQFADAVARLRDAGRGELVLAIGGPDGNGAALAAAAAETVSFGRMTLPHQLVRVVLAEQLYRAVTLLSGHPYHRD